MQLRFFLLGLTVSKNVLEIGKSEDDKWLYDFAKKQRQGILKGFKGIDIETLLFLKEMKYAL